MPLRVAPVVAASGLGLHLVQEIFMRHGDTIHATDAQAAAPGLWSACRSSQAGVILRVKVNLPAQCWGKLRRANRGQRQ